jgi:hypothetical protein
VCLSPWHRKVSIFFIRGFFSVTTPAIPAAAGRGTHGDGPYSEARRGNEGSGRAREGPGTARGSGKGRTVTRGGWEELCADLRSHLANFFDRLEYAIYRSLRFLYRTVPLAAARILHHEPNGKGVDRIDKAVLDPPAYAEHVFGAEIPQIVIEWAHGITLPRMERPVFARGNLTLVGPWGPSASPDAMQTLQFGDQLRCAFVNSLPGRQPNHSRFAVHPMTASSSDRDRWGASRGRKFRLRP